MTFTSFIYSFQLVLRQRSLRLYHRILAGFSGVAVDSEKPIERILFIVAGLIGDSVMCLPTIMEARRIWPEARITILGKRHNRELISACSFFNEFYECNVDPFSLRRTVEIKRLQEWLIEQKFDAAVILLGSQYAHLLAKAKIPIRVGIKGSIMEPCLTKTYDIGSPRTWGVIEKLSSIRQLGVSVDPVLPKLTVDGVARHSLNEILLGLGIGVSDRYVVLHPFGSTRRQWLGLEKILPLAEKIYDQYNVKCLLIGGKETEIDLNIKFPLIDSRGKLSLPELLAAIDESEIVITTDSGPFHIAGGLGKKIVGLFRSRRPEHVNAYPNTKVIYGSDRRCDADCEWDRCSVEPCRQMTEISVSDIIAAIEGL